MTAIEEGVARAAQTPSLPDINKSIDAVLLKRSEECLLGESVSTDGRDAR